MKFSRYLKVYPYEESPSQLLLFSTRKMSKIILNKETYQAIENNVELSPSDEALLSKLGMIVHDKEEEKQAVFRLFDNLNTKNNGVHVIAVLNLDCNFACTYCYEGGMKGKLYMSDETADHLVDFIKKKFPRHKKSLLIDFFGGEPLLSIGLIKRISKALRSFTESRGASYSFTLVTNGSLFTKKTAEELVALGLEGVKITLDGPAETHNQSRPFKSGAKSFATLIKNIKETCDLVKIGIGGNFTKDNYDKFPLLLDYMAREGLTPDKIASVKFDPVMKQPEGNFSLPEYGSGCTSVNEPWLMGVVAYLREEILKRGYNTQKIMPMTCMVESTNSYVVNFDGVVCKCPGFIGKKGYEVGDLLTGTKDCASYKPGIWKNEDCAGCEYLPLCYGGCRYMTFLRNGTIDTVDCQKAYLDASLEALVKQDIKYKLKADNR
ncbi:MAG: geopeptide radical SAM maturase [Proteobacteria bacterium]|nr:geopeptide radical SAM maturase [Pseudomonadota bacterium]